MAAPSESKLSADEINWVRDEYERNHVFCMGVERDRQGRWRLPQNKVGQGAYGKVYEVCRSDNRCDYVMKIVRLGDSSVSKAQFKKEVALQKEAHKLEVAPPIVDSWICQEPSIGVIIMPTLKRTLKDILRSKKTSENTKQKRIAEAQELLNILNLSNFRHNDSHLNNFMEGVGGKLYLIDYGLAASEKTTPKKWKRIKKWESWKKQPTGADDRGLESTSDQTIFENFLKLFEAKKRLEAKFSPPPHRTTVKRVTGIRSH